MEQIKINNNSSQHKLVYGLGGAFCTFVGGEERKWRENLPKVLKSFGNTVLLTPADITYEAARIVYESVGQDRLIFDSGGYTLYKKEAVLGPDNPAFHKLCESMKRKLFKLLTIAKPKQIFELDNDYFKVSDDLLDPRNFCREEIKEILGFYPTPVFKMHQGFEYWKALCESPLYPTLSIGGLAHIRAWHTRVDEIKIMMDYARHCGKKVHLLGCQNVEAFKTIQPDTVDYSIIQYAININKVKKEHPELTTHQQQKKHIALYALAAANQRSFLYDNYHLETDDSNE